MKQKVAHQIIDCLALSGVRGDPAPLAGLSRRRWEQVIQWLDEGGLTLSWWNRWKTLGSEALVPAELRARLDRNLLDNTLRVAAMAEELDSINGRLEDFGVRYVAFKGFALVPAYCPEACLCTSYDYDYLLPPDSMERAEEALTSVGYNRIPNSAAYHTVYAPVAWTPHPPSCRDDLYSPQFPRLVELHTRPWDLGPLTIKMALPENPWERRHLRTWRGVSFYGLAEEDELAYQVLHIFHHILDYWCRLGWLLGIAHFLDQRARDSAFWQPFCEYLGDHHPLPQVAGVVFQLAASLFGTAVPEAVERKIFRWLPDSLTLWVEQYGRSSALKNFTDGRHSSLFLHREFIDIGEEAAWRKVRREGLFPLHLPAWRTTAPIRSVSALLETAWMQGVYVAERLRRYLKAAILYSWHSHRWKQIRGKRRGADVLS